MQAQIESLQPAMQPDTGRCLTCPPQVLGRCMSRAAMQCSTSCDPARCMQQRHTCQPLDASVCAGNLSSTQPQYGNDPNATAKACKAATLCSALTSSAGMTADAACSATHLAQCPDDNCESCKAQVAKLSADVAAAPVTQCKGGEDSRPSKQRLCLRTVAGLVEASQACTEVAAMFPLWKTNTEALNGAGNFTEFCSKVAGGMLGGSLCMSLLYNLLARFRQRVGPRPSESVQPVMIKAISPTMA